MLITVTVLTLQVAHVDKSLNIISHHVFISLSSFLSIRSIVIELTRFSLCLIMLWFLILTSVTILRTVVSLFLGTSQQPFTLSLLSTLLSLSHMLRLTHIVLSCNHSFPFCVRVQVQLHHFCRWSHTFVAHILEVT